MSAMGSVVLLGMVWPLSDKMSGLVMELLMEMVLGGSSVFEKVNLSVRRWESIHRVHTWWLRMCFSDHPSCNLCNTGTNCSDRSKRTRNHFPKFQCRPRDTE